jgi:sugar phosphate isomerase/epimerase
VEAPVNRRDFFARAAALPVGASAVVGLGGVGTSGPAAAQAPIRRAGGPRLKTSLNAYSFSKALDDQLKARGQGVSLFDLLEFCAENDFDALDPTGYFFPGYPEVPKDDYLNRFKRRAFQLGVDISGTGVRNDFASPDKAKRAADVRHAKEWVEVAARMGAPVLRVFAGPVPEGHPTEDVFRWMADALRECAEHGAKYGVLVGVQNHGDMLKTADDVLKLLKMVDSDWLGSIVDTGYFLSPDPYQDIARVTPYAVNWQVKEKTDGAAGKSKTDLRRLVNIMREGGYRGYVPIETLSVRGSNEPYDPRARVVQLLRELREAMKQA